MSQPPKTAKDIFLAALDADPAARVVLLDDLCAGDVALRRQVEALLQVHDEPDSFLDSPRIDLGVSAETGVLNDIPTIDQPSIEALGTVIGPYKLLQKIGEGGFGVVYMAEQSEPVERRVALKIIKPGMDTRQVIARFETEQQALARMEHPNIAKVFDAGMTDSGRPYFVMELVRGVPITDYCDQRHLTPRERLELFVPVCHAVQHAHQKGIIHRDLKPSNVLVALYDDKPVPKVIDFGVAKATSQRLTEKTMFTQFGQIVGTLEYMSPEQANLNQLDIDTRSDVYSLGVLLYELLTGTTPFDRQRLRSAAFDEMMRIIREEEPPKPSTRLSTSESLPSIAANRHIEPKKLSTLVRGELDWIVMKALEKDRARRYETANGFANDIQRYLSDEPVAACPPSAAYRFRKFVSRNKVTFVTASLIALALVLGLVGTSWQAVRATHAERAAQRNFAEEQKSRRQATQQRDRAVRAEASASRARDQALAAERDAKRQLFNTYCAQAKASRWSGRPGQRVEALTAIERAVKLIEPLGLDEASRQVLRNEAIGALTLVDISPLKTQRCLTCTNSWVTVSPDCRIAAVSAGPHQPIRLYSVDDPARILVQIPIGQSQYGEILHLGPDARYLLRGTVISTTWQLSDASTGSDLFRVPNLPQVSAADFHPRGQELAAGGMDGIVRFFELPTGEELRRFSCDHALSVVKFSPSGSQVAVSAMAEAIEIRDSQTGEVSFQWPSLGARTLAWRPDGDWIAAGTDSDIQLVEIREPGGGQITCQGHQSTVINVQFHPQGQVLASAAWDGTTRIWDAGSGHQLLRTEGDVIRFGVDGRLLALGKGLDLTLWEVQTPEGCRWLHKGMTRAATVAPGGRLLVSSHDDGLRLWDLQRFRQVAYLPIGPTSDVAFHPANKGLVTSGDAGLCQWPFTMDVVDASVRVRLGPPQKIESELTSWRTFDLSQDGRTCIVEGHYRDEAVILHLDSTPPRPIRLTGPGLVNVALSRDGKWAAVAAELGQHVRIYSAATGEVVCDLPTTNSAQIRFSPDNRWVVTNTGPDICIWEVGSWQRRHEIPTDCDSCSGIAFTADSHIVAVGVWGIGIRLIEVETGQPIATLEAVQKPPAYVDLNFSADDSLLAAAVDHEGLCVWDIRTIRQRLATLGLDWNQPALPAAEPSDRPFLEVEVNLGALGGPDRE